MRFSEPTDPKLVIRILPSRDVRPAVLPCVTGWAVNPSAGWKLGFGFSRLNAAFPIAWRIILGTVSRIRITPINFQPFSWPFGRGPTTRSWKGTKTLSMVIINHLLTGMILEVVGKTSQGFVHTLSCIVGISWFREKYNTRWFNLWPFDSRWLEVTFTTFRSENLPPNPHLKKRLPSLN